MDSTASVVLVVGLLFLGAVAGANLSVAAERTALDAGYATDTMASEGVFADVAVDVRTEVAAGIDSGVRNATVPAGIVLEAVNGSRIATRSVSDDEITAQLRGMVEAIYDFLHGRQDDLELVFDFTGIRDDLGTSIADAVRIDTPVLVGEPLARVDTGPVAVDVAVLRDLERSQESYRATRRTLMVDFAFETASHDTLLALVVPDYDPSSYTDAEKARMVRDREAEIRSALRDELETNAELRRTIDAERDRLNSELKMTADAELAAELQGVNESVAAAVSRLQRTVIDGLTASELEYDEYTDRLEANERRVATAIARVAVQNVPDEVAVGEEGQDPTETFRSAARLTGLLTTAAWLLPIVAVILLGGVALVSGSFERTATTAGTAVLGAGVVGLVVGVVLRDWIVSRFESIAAGGQQGPLLDGMSAVVDGMLAAVVTQSIALSIAGVGLLGLAAADRRGRLDGARRTLGVPRDRDEAGEASSDDEAGEASSDDEAGEASDGDEADGASGGGETDAASGGDETDGTSGGDETGGTVGDDPSP